MGCIFNLCVEKNKKDINENLMNTLTEETPLYTVTKNDFQVLKLIGKGSLGKVFLVVKKDTRVYYAMKVLEKKKIDENKEQIRTITEKNILIACSSPFIVKLRYSFQDTNKIYMVMDLMQGGKLFLHIKESGKFTEEHAQFYIAEIILALEHLHGKGIIYRDLKPQNILLDHEGHIKLTNFGLSKTGITQENPKTYTFCGVTEYLAPEILRNQAYDKSVDYWSLGALLYEMISGKPPFSSKNKSEIYKKINNRLTETKNYFSDDTVDLINQLMALNVINIQPTDRLSNFENIKSHTFFKNIQWDKLQNKEIPAPIKPKIIGFMDMTHYDSECIKKKIEEFKNPSVNSVTYTYPDFTYLYSD